MGAGAVWSLEPTVGGELERAEETGAGSAACCTVGRWREAREESPASGIMVRGDRDSPSDAEGRTGS